MAITATVAGARELLDKFDGVPSRIRIELARGIVRATLLVQSQAKTLAPVKTGRLRRSIASRTEVGDTTVSGIVGTNVEYARVVEYGFQGTESVREHLRKCVSGKEVTVRAHERHVNIPERSYLRAALDRMAPEIRAEFQAAMSRAFNQ